MDTLAIIVGYTVGAFILIVGISWLVLSICGPSCSSPTCDPGYTLLYQEERVGKSVHRKQMCVKFQDIKEPSYKGD